MHPTTSATKGPKSARQQTRPTGASAWRLAGAAPGGRHHWLSPLAVLAVLGLIVASCSGSIEVSAPDVEPTPVPTDAPESSATTPPVEPTERPEPTTPSAPVIPGDGELLPVDVDVRIGTLDNGLTFYIRNNTAPGSRAELRLAVRAGSALEDDDQSAVAHFLEHMLFNGTTKYPSNDLVALLESFGSQFGPDVNAYTSFDETVYELSIPTDNFELFEEAFDVLFEWAANATIDPAEVEAERGVVLEEWRLRDQGIGGRINNVYTDLLTPGTAYEGRLPIGEPAAIEAMSADVLRRFYEDWYRPDLMAVVAVGDFDVDAVEQLIRERFEVLESPDDPRRPDVIEVADADTFEYVRHEDPELPNAFIEIIYPGQADSITNVGEYRSALAYGLASQAIGNRFGDDVSRGEAPYLAAYVSTTPLARNLDTPGLLAEAPAADLEESFRLLLVELQRVRRNGFSDAEIDRVTASSIASVEQLYAGRDTTQDADYASEYVNHFLGETSITGWDDFIALETRLLSEMTPEYVAAVYLETISGRAPQVVVIGPQSDSADMPSEETVRRLLDEVPDGDIAARVDDSRDIESLMERPEPAVATRTGVVELDATKLVFPNGVTVLLKQTQIAENSFDLRGVNPGGYSVLHESDLAAAFLMQDVVFASGVDDLDQVELDRLLADEVAFAVVSMAETEEIFLAGGATEDAELVLQLLNRYLEAPRVQASALDAGVIELGPFADDPGKVPFLAAEAELLDARYQSDPRHRLFPTVDAISELTVADLERVYNQALGDASGSVFAIAGDFDLAEMENLVAAYLGTLSSDGSPDNFVDVLPPPPPGIVEREVQAGQDSQGSTTIVFTAETDSDLVTDIELQVLQNIVSTRLRDRLREALGATYSPSASLTSTAQPDRLIETRVDVSADPARLDEIVDETLAVITDLLEGGLTQTEVATAREQVRRDFELVSNRFWMDQMLYSAAHPGLRMLTVPQRIQTAAGVSVADLTTLAREIFQIDRYIVINLVPVG